MESNGLLDSQVEGLGICERICIVWVNVEQLK